MVLRERKKEKSTEKGKKHGKREKHGKRKKAREEKVEIYVCSFTEKGKNLGIRTFSDWEPERIRVRTGERLSEWTKAGFTERAALVFIGAAGIAVRAIAPYVKDKLSDSPVIVMDEGGRFVIPLLSGHVGGANELAVRIAEKTGAAAVITTATDVNHRFAVDVFAKKNHLTIVKREGIAKVSAKILGGAAATISVQPYPWSEGAGQAPRELPQELEWVEYPPKGTVDILISTEECHYDQAVLPLKPKQYVLGMGCKKGKSMQELDGFIRESCRLAQQRTGEKIEISDIACLASIDRKKEEEGFVKWSQKNGIPFVTFSQDELLALPGKYTGSSFVARQVGVDNVCERSAVAGAFYLYDGGTEGKNRRDTTVSGKQGRDPEKMLILTKTSGDGMTAALARRDWRLDFDEA